jgi:hypothetical protein
VKPFPRSHPRSLAQCKRIGERGWRRGRAPIPLVNLSKRMLCGIGRDPWLVMAAACKHSPSDARELVSEGDCQQIAMGEALGGLLDPGPEGAHRCRGAPLEDDTWAARTKRVRRYLLPRLEILPSKVRSPVDSCFGTRPSQAAKSRPCLKPLPVPMAATMALEMIGPIPGTVVRRCSSGIKGRNRAVFRHKFCALERVARDCP